MTQPKTPRTPKKRVPNKAAPVWETLRSRYPAAVQALGDAAAVNVTLRDLLALEVSEHTVLDDQFRATASSKNRLMLMAAKVQSRKAQRALLMLCPPETRTARDPVRLADGMDTASILARVALLEEDEIIHT